MYNKGLFVVFGVDLYEREILCIIFFLKLYIENNFIILFGCIVNNIL